MFRSSRGMGGGGNKSGSGGGGGGVSNKASIVVVNKMAAITQTLQSNYQQATNTVAEQVAKNSADIKNIYELLYSSSKARLAVERKETADLRAETAKRKFALREKLVEGLASAVAGATNSLGKAVNSAVKPLKSWWDKLKEALLLFAAAWAIDNLPAILDLARGLYEKVQELFGILTSFPESIRGLGVIFDGIFRRSLKLIGGILKWAGDITGTILKGIKRFTFSLVRGIRRVIGRVLGSLMDLLKGARNAAGRVFGGGRPSSPNSSPDSPRLRPGADASPSPGSASPSTKPGGAPRPGSPSPGGGGGNKTFIENITQLIPKGVREGATRITDSVGNTYNNMKTFISNTISTGKEKLSSVSGSIKENATKILGNKKATTTPAQQEGWIKRTLDPLADIPVLKSALGNTAGLARKLLRSVPLLGMAIDIFLNRKIEGQNWTESIIRGMLSGTAGAVGAAGGAKIGGLIGAGAGSVVPGIGTILGGLVGSALGGLVGSILAGAVGDKVGGMTYEKFTGMPASGNTVTDSIIDAGISATNSFTGSGGTNVDDDTKKVSIPTNNIQPVGEDPNRTNIGTSPSNVEKTTTFEQLPPNITSIDAPKTDTNPVMQNNLPKIKTSDTESDYYRGMAMDKFDLVFNGN